MGSIVEGGGIAGVGGFVRVGGDAMGWGKVAHRMERGDQHRADLILRELAGLSGFFTLTRS